MQLVDQVQETLERISELGDEHAIAAYLQDQRVHGRRGQASACPLAVFLRRETGVACVDVLPDVTSVADSFLPNPLAVSRFVTLFDTGHFTSLKQ
jgi:hypothetical protein